VFLTLDRRGRLLLYPPRGRLLFATDFHGQLADFLKMKEIFLRRRAAEEDLFLLLAGDLVHGPGPERAHQGDLRPDESPALLRAFERLQAREPERVHCLLGNHELGHLGGARPRKFHHSAEDPSVDDVSALERRLGMSRAEEVRQLFSGFPLMALTPCGAVLSHAAPALPRYLEGEALRTIAAAEPGRDDELLREFTETRWIDSEERVDALLEAFSEAGQPAHFMVYGHDVVPRGIYLDDYRQVVVSTSFGIPDERKTYLDLDLAGSYADPSQLRPGREIRRLHDCA